MQEGVLSSIASKLHAGFFAVSCSTLRLYILPPTKFTAQP